MGIPYEKPHLTYDEQIDKLVGRGLEVSDRAAAIDALKSIGYYRLSAYLHTFRPVKADGASGHDERLNSYYPGSTYEQVVELWMFDRALRLVLLDGLEQFLQRQAPADGQPALAFIGIGLDDFVPATLGICTDR